MNLPIEQQNGQEPGSAQYYDVDQETPLREYVAIIMRGKWTILLTLLLIVGAVAVYTFTVRPIYESSSLVLVDMKGKDGALPVFDITGSATANKITNELEILKSNATAESVARALLARRFVDGEPGVQLEIIAPDREAQPGDSLATVDMVVDRLSKAVEFTPIRESDIIRLTARSTNPHEAAMIANVYMGEYTSRNLDNSRMRSQAVREFLQDQLRSKRSVLDTTENDLQQYMRASGVVSLDAEANKVVEQLSQLEAQRDGMEIDKSSRLKALASYKEELARQEPNAAKAIGESNDNYIKLLQEQLAKLEVQRDVTIAQNPDIVQEELYSEKLKEINDQIKEIKKRLDERTKKYLSSLLPGDMAQAGASGGFVALIKQKIIEQQIELGSIDARIHALNSVLADYEKKFNQIPQKSIDLAKLQRSRLSSEKLYLLVEEKYNEAAIKEKSEFGYVNIIDPAKVTIKPVSPRKALNLILAFIIGLAAGIGIVLTKAFVDRRIRTPEDLKRCGFIPLSSVSLMNGELKKIEQEIAHTPNDHTFDIHLVSHYRPLSPVSESYRHLRTNVQYVQVDKPLQCLVVTSANPKEGKSTTTSNLAISFSQAEKKVLLVDADMRRSTIHTIFGIKNEIGINEHLFGEATYEQVVQKNVLPNLDIIPCGVKPPNPAEVLGSKRMKDFIEAMKKRYDLVLFDSPPLLAVTDSAVLATGADGVLLIASAGSTQAAGLERISEFLTHIGVKVLGVVLNKFDAREAYGGYYSGYHYGYYGYESGYYRDDEKKPSRRKVSA